MVHLIRAAMRFVNHKGPQGRRGGAEADLHPRRTPRPPGIELDTFADSTWGKSYPHAVATWRAAWERFTPFLAFPPELRRVIYTTNSIESLNYQLRKVTKNRGHFFQTTRR